MFVENKAPCILGPLPNVLFLPGITFVQDKTWEQVILTSFYARHTEDLMAIEATRGKEDLKSLDEKQAIKIVCSVTDRKLLQSLKRKEQRAAVLDEIDIRLAKITPEVRKEEN